ncbi:hypothetical protein BJY00DRAFT_197891 [Aspergillus carlsbadensis]|nr:hypothetical protein BJY00DRAFT_197891 [Aspergillus carlsbadensis]
MAQPEEQLGNGLQERLKDEPKDEFKAQAKRVILRLAESDMDYRNLREFVDFYFTKFPSDAALDSTRHYVHYEPPSDFPQPNPKVHIVIDIETFPAFETLPKDFPHELYKVRRGVDNLEIYGYPEAMKQNMLQKVRHFSDDFYPWGYSRGDRRAGSS